MGAGNDIEIPSFSIDIELIEIQKDISIDIEIWIYDPNTNIATYIFLVSVKFNN